MKLHGFCEPSFIWYEPSPTDNHTLVWKGSTIWLLLDILQISGLAREESIEIVTTFPPLKGDPLLEPVVEGYVDVSPLQLIMSFVLKEHVDFSLPTFYNHLRIISKRQTPYVSLVSEDFVGNMFDWPTTLLIAGTVLLITILVFFAYNYEETTLREKLSIDYLSCICLSFFGIFFKQGFSNTFRIGRRGSSLVIIFAVFTFMITTLYTGVLKVKLIMMEEPQQIQNLEDLRAKADVKIILTKRGWMYNYVAASPTLKEFHSRMDIEDISVNNEITVEAIVEKVLQDGAVILEDDENFDALLRLSGNTYDMATFYFSEALASWAGAWIFPKGNKSKNPILKEKITLFQQWLGSYYLTYAFQGRCCWLLPQLAQTYWVHQFWH